MNYSELVDSYIKNSGLSLAEISKRMIEDKGVKVDRSYISKLRNDPKYPASDEVNRAFAEVTGGNIEALLEAAYFNRAPEEIRDKNVLIEEQRELTAIYLVDTLIKYLETYRQTGEKDMSKLNMVYALSDLMHNYKFTLQTDLLEHDPEEATEAIRTLKYFFFHDLKTLSHENIFINFSDYVDDSGNTIRRNNPYPERVRKTLELEEAKHKAWLKSQMLLAESSTPYAPESMLRLPVLGSIRAGEPTARIENNEGYTLVDPELMRGREGFALRVKGDSMIGDRIQEGDIVIVVKTQEVLPNEIAVVAVDDEEATLKRVKQQGDMCMLVPSNPSMTPDLYPCNKIKIIGKVVEVKFWPK